MGILYKHTKKVLIVFGIIIGMFVAFVASANAMVFYDDGVGTFDPLEQETDSHVVVYDAGFNYIIDFDGNDIVNETIISISDLENVYGGNILTESNFLVFENDDEQNVNDYNDYFDAEQWSNGQPYNYPNDAWPDPAGRPQCTVTVTPDTYTAGGSDVVLSWEIIDPLGNGLNWVYINNQQGTQTTLPNQLIGSTTITISTDTTFLFRTENQAGDCLIYSDPITLTTAPPPPPPVTHTAGEFSFVDKTKYSPTQLVATVKAGTASTTDKTLPLAVFVGIPVGFTIVLLLIGMINRSLTPEPKKKGGKGKNDDNLA